jgi:hypothetical protein
VSFFWAVGEAQPTSKMPIVIDASHCGGMYCGPQKREEFDVSLPHGGERVETTLRNLGFKSNKVLATQDQVAAADFPQGGVVIRFNGFGAYTDAEVQKYADYVDKGGAVLLLGHFMREGQTDRLAEKFDIVFSGMFRPTPGAKWKWANPNMRMMPPPFTIGAIVSSAPPGANPHAYIETDGKKQLVMGYVEHGQGRLIFMSSSLPATVASNQWLASVLRDLTRKKKS